MALKNPADAVLLKKLMKRRNKHGNVPTSVCGIKFDSAAEAERYIMLTMLENAGIISALSVKPPYKLAGGSVKFIPDFEYTRNGVRITEDVKGGKITEGFSVKARLFEHETGRKVHIWRKKK